MPCNSEPTWGPSDVCAVDQLGRFMKPKLQVQQGLHISSNGTVSYIQRLVGQYSNLLHYDRCTMALILLQCYLTEWFLICRRSYLLECTGPGEMYPFDRRFCDISLVPGKSLQYFLCQGFQGEEYAKFHGHGWYWHFNQYFAFHRMLFEIYLAVICHVSYVLYNHVLFYVLQCCTLPCSWEWTWGTWLGLKVRQPNWSYVW